MHLLIRVSGKSEYLMFVVFSSFSDFSQEEPIRHSARLCSEGLLLPEWIGHQFRSQKLSNFWMDSKYPHRRLTLPLETKSWFQLRLSLMTIDFLMCQRWPLLHSDSLKVLEQESSKPVESASPLINWSCKLLLVRKLFWFFLQTILLLIKR